MFTFTDPLGKTITLAQTPQRIVSLVPSQTELLSTLGLEKEVVGITRFCVRPSSWFREKTRIGGTKDIHPDRVHALRPDLILANKEENDRSQVEALARQYPVWVSDVPTLSDALTMIRTVGSLTGKNNEADSLATAIDLRFSQLKKSLPLFLKDLSSPITPSPPSGNVPLGTSSPRTAYFIWRNPWMVAGGDTFISDMLQRCGLTNAFQHLDRYPTVDLASLAGADIQCILLSSEPYPFKEQHIREISALLPAATIRLVDGELFSWYGSRLLGSPAYFRQLADSLLS